MKILQQFSTTVICIGAIACGSGPSPQPLAPSAPRWRIVAESPIPDDAVVIRLFDAEHAPAIAGPVATPESVRRILGARLAQGDRDHRPVIAGLPLFGYFWRASQPPMVIALDDARRAAAEANVELARDPASGSLHAIQPGTWELWIVDEQAFATLRDAAASLGVTRVARFVTR